MPAAAPHAIVCRNRQPGSSISIGQARHVHEIFVTCAGRRCGRLAIFPGLEIARWPGSAAMAIRSGASLAPIRKHFFFEKKEAKNF